MILGDLIVTDIGSWKINKRLKSEVRVRSISGTTKKECPQHKDCLIRSEPDKIVFHHGTNYLMIQLLPDDIANNIIYIIYIPQQKLVPKKFPFQVFQEK